MVGRSQLFLSRRLVTETDIFDGGVFVNENGVIKDVLTRKQADDVIATSGEKIDVVDGGDLALLAGVVDSHVHINEPGRTAWEGFRTATNAAAAGGITTVVDMPLNSIPPTTTLENLKTKANSAKDNVYVDVGFWGGVIPGNQNFLRDLVKAGVVGFKCFLCPSGVEEFPNVQSQDLELAFEALKGTGSVLAFHAEVEDEDESGSDKKIPKKDPEEYETYLDSRPPKMELNAITLVTNLLAKTDVRVHIVHVSSASVVPLLTKAREERIANGHPAWQGGVTAETCHHYLSLSSEEIPKGRSEYKCAPPIRDTANKEKLWEYLLDDKLDMVVSDHSPCTPELKCSNNLEAWGGISSVQFGLSLFWTQASRRGLDLRTISKYLSIGPATLCGLQHRKGALKTGLDADLIFFDPDESFTVTPDIIRHKSKFHAEVEDEDESGSDKKIPKKDPEEYETYLDSRPPKMELNAITLVTNLLAKTDVRVHIVHVSSASVVPLLTKAREERIANGHPAWQGGVTAETCHHYLSLSSEEIPKGRSEYKCAPPIRDTANKEKLWEYLLDDKLDMVVSDHSPCTPELKCSNNLEAWGGISSVQFGLSLFWTQASRRGLDLRTISKYLSIGPATLCGLQHRKGALKTGLDADLIFFDPDESFTVTPDIIRHKSKLTPYIGKKLKGVVKKTFIRGKLIYANGEVIGEPKGYHGCQQRNVEIKEKDKYDLLIHDIQNS